MEQPIPPPPPPPPPINQSRSTADDIVNNKYAIIAFLVLWVGWPFMISLGCLITSIVMFCLGSTTTALWFGGGFVLAFGLGALWIYGPGGNIH